MLKRLTGLFLILALMVAQIPVLGEEEFFFDDEETVSFDDEDMGPAAGAADIDFSAYSYEELTVGNPTPVEGNFFTGLWGSNTSDMDIRQLLNAYNLIYWNNEEGLYAMNPAAVSGNMVMNDDAGNRTYVLTLYRDLYFSDGTAITARDYAFSILLRISPLISELGGKPVRDDFILGYEAYMNGEKKELEGLRVVSDDELMITIRAEYLPFFYELGLLDCWPCPMHIIAPGCRVEDDGSGAWISGDFTADLLRSTILDPETGYLSHPSVVSGPYSLTGYDGETVELEINPYFKGDSDNVVPTIQRLKLVKVDPETMMDSLTNGDVGLLNKVALAEHITAGTALIGTGAFGMASYPRTGMAFLAFCCEKPTVSSQAVRQALARCLDRDQLIMDYTGNYGMKVNGYYGLGQWMYQMLSGTMGYPVQEPEDESAAAQKAYEEELAAWEELSLDSIPSWDLDVEKANELLDQDGWTLNEQGALRSGGEIRCREADGVLVPLRLKMAYTEGIGIEKCLADHFIPYLEQAGISLEMVPVSAEELLDQYYHRSERTADMLFLGTNFETLFDPAASFEPSAGWNNTGISDEALYEAALDLRRTEPGNVLEYCRKWLAFQSQFTESMPVIPLFSNVYFDFYSGILHNYYPSESVSWSRAVLPAFLGDADDPEEEEEFEEELEEDEVLFDD